MIWILLAVVVALIAAMIWMGWHFSVRMMDLQVEMRERDMKVRERLDELKTDVGPLEELNRQLDRRIEEGLLLLEHYDKRGIRLTPKEEDDA